MRRSRHKLSDVCANLTIYLFVFIAATNAQIQKPPVATVASAKQISTSPYPASELHPPPAWFIDVGPQAGLRMRNVNGGVETKQYIIETTGSGVAIFDYDNDGWPDIFLVNGTTLDGAKVKDANPTSHLFHNNHDGTFTDVTRAAGLDFTGWGQGVCVGDYDNDGYDDLYVTYYGKNRLYHNEGNGTFKEVAEAAGVAGDGTAWGTGCAFVDYDRDGKLDLLVANYVRFDLKTSPKPGQGLMCVWKGTPVMCGPRGLDSSPNILYHNLGNGKFADVSKSSGIEKTDGHYCFSVSTLDYDDDGWPDIYVACDSTPSILYHNLKNGTFVDVAPEAGVAFNEDGREQAGMGSTIGDYDGDGRPDIFKTNFSDDYIVSLSQQRGWNIFFDDFRRGPWTQHALSRLGNDVYRCRQRRASRHSRRQRTRLSGSGYGPPRLLLSRTAVVVLECREWKVQRYQPAMRPRLHTTSTQPRPRHRRSVE